MKHRADGGGVIRRFREWLPVPPGAPVISLGEGSTPLIPAPVLSARTGCEVYLKVEGANPTGSFKDRGMTVAVSMAAAQGAKAVICASTGNTSASAAAYAARGGLTCAVLVPRGKIALGKLAPSCSRWTATSTTAWNWPASSPWTTRWPWSTR
jgi:threonine synthase